MLSLTLQDGILTVLVVARGCVEQATEIGTPNAIRYVRRAAELCEALDTPVLGLSQECLDYIKAHPSNVYDMPALHLFARGLLQSGQRDKAAAVYFTLLQVPEYSHSHSHCSSAVLTHSCRVLPVFWARRSELVSGKGEVVRFQVEIW